MSVPGAAARPEPKPDEFDRRDPANIAPLVVWLGSAASGDVTGQVFNVAGGMIGVAESWKRGPSQDKGDRWAPAELGRRARDLSLAIEGPAGMLVGDDAPAGGRFQQMALRIQSSSIAGGTDEVQRNIIGERVLGLPKEPQVDRDVPFRETRTS